MLVTKQCAVTFAIRLFKDTVHCDVAPLDCSEIPLGSTTPTGFQKDEKVYKLTSSSLPSPSDRNQVMKQCNTFFELPVTCQNKSGINFQAAPFFIQAIATGHSDVFEEPRGFSTLRS